MEGAQSLKDFKGLNPDHLQWLGFGNKSIWGKVKEILWFIVYTVLSFKTVAINNISKRKVTLWQKYNWMHL